MEWTKITKNNIDTIKHIYNNKIGIIIIAHDFEDYNLVSYYQLNDDHLYDITIYMKSEDADEIGCYYYIVLPKLK